MQTLQVVADWSVENTGLSAYTLARLVLVCKDAAVFKKDCYWRPLLQAKYPKHPGKRAYRRYCCKSNHQLHLGMAQRRQARLTHLMDNRYWILLNQRPLGCWCCGKMLQEHVWTRDTTGKEPCKGFSPPYKRWYEWRHRVHKVPSYRPICTPCCDGLTERPWTFGDRPEYEIQDPAAVLVDQHRLRQLGRRGRHRFQSMCVVLPLRLLARDAGSKRNAKIRWLYRRWKRDPLHEAEFRAAKEQRKRHACAAIARQDPKADLNLAMRAKRKEKRKAGRRKAAANKAKKLARRKSKGTKLAYSSDTFIV